MSGPNGLDNWMRTWGWKVIIVLMVVSTLVRIWQLSPRRQSELRGSRVSCSICSTMRCSILAEQSGGGQRSGRFSDRQAIDRLSLTLDEWPTLMKSARDALRGPPGEMTTQLQTLRSVLPPASDIDAPDSKPMTDDDEGSPSVSQVLGTRLSAIWLMLSASRRTRQ